MKIFMTDQQTVEHLISGDPRTIKDFFFVRCRPMLVYIGHYFCRQRQTPEELIGEFYEYLSANDWHKLRIFKYSCSLKSYVTIIASRYFQHKRDQELLPLDDTIAILKNLQETECDIFFMGDLKKNTFMECWNSKEFQKLREAHLTNCVKGTACEKCLSDFLNGDNDANT